MKRKTLYQRLKPEVKAGLESKSNDRYRFSTNIIVSLLKSKQFYSDLTIDQVKNIIVFSDINPKSVFDIQYGDFLFEPNLNEGP
jgi:hypothetical protein|tara:strand:- start:266 stop:517 length:252 start_codon:yes stop_codon:yes gene_type:complete